MINNVFRSYHSFAVVVLILLACIAFSSSHAGAQVKLPSVICDHMVLQRNMEVPLWGWAFPGEKVQISGSWGEQSAEVETGAFGRWQTKIKTPDAGGPYTLTVKGKNEITLNDILVGEVWICSGQSNMEMPIGTEIGFIGIYDFEKEAKEANYEKIRFFNVERACEDAPQGDCQGTWQACTPDSVWGFSAVAYYFGRKLHMELGVPVGLIASNWGGTPAESWTSEEAIKIYGEFDEGLERMRISRENPLRLEKDYHNALEQWWRDLEDVDQGSGDGETSGWMRANLGHGAWSTMTLPGKWEDSEVGEFDGLVWFRKDIEILEAWAGKELVLELGPIDDMDVAWFNGHKVGGIETIGHWRSDRAYIVPSSLVKAGNNIIALRVLDTGGPGGLCGTPEKMLIRLAGNDESDTISLAGEWRYRCSADLSELSTPFPVSTKIDSHTPGSLYNGMIAPLIPFGMRGAIWYQGESNRLRAHQYRSLFPHMIQDWRNRWGQGDFPFYFVQIAPFDYDYDYEVENTAAAELREAQFMTLSVKNTGMAVTLDIGDNRDIHPRNKKDVGLRLARWALAKTYGKKGLVCSGPLYRNMVKEKGRIRLFFDYTGSGLKALNGELGRFHVAGIDRVFHPARAVIDKETVLVSSDKVDQPMAVRYAWCDMAEASLFNEEGLPASPFRTDDWPGTTGGQ